MVMTNDPLVIHRRQPGAVVVPDVSPFLAQLVGKLLSPSLDALCLGDSMASLP